MSIMTKKENKISEGDLVTLRKTWQARLKPGEIMKDLAGIPGSDPFLGIVTYVRLGAGMYENNHYATVLWENNRHAEHYLKDLVKVQQ